MAKRPKTKAATPPADEAADSPVSAIETPTLGLSDEQVSEEAHGDHAAPLVPAASLDAAPRARQADDSRPFCPTHNCLLKAQSTKPTATHYKCPVPGCQSREKRARPQLKVPAEPMACPQRTCRTPEGETLSFLEADGRLSNLAQLHMHCPQCGFHVKVPRPQFAATLVRDRARKAEDLAVR